MSTKMPTFRKKCCQNQLSCQNKYLRFVAIILLAMSNTPTLPKRRHSQILKSFTKLTTAAYQMTDN